MSLDSCITHLYKTLPIDEAITAYTNGVDVSKESKRSVLPEDQLTRIFDNVPHKAKALSVTGNRLLFANYKDGIDLEGYSPSFNINKNNVSEKERVLELAKKDIISFGQLFLPEDFMRSETPFFHYEVADHLISL